MVEMRFSRCVTGVVRRRYDFTVTPGQGRDGPRKTRATRTSRVGARITHERLRRGWTQQRMAKHFGVALLTAQRWERGETEPRDKYRAGVDRFLAGE